MERLVDEAVRWAAVSRAGNRPMGDLQIDGISRAVMSHLEDMLPDEDPRLYYSTCKEVLGPIYIAGKMRGMPDFNYPKFNELAQKWRDRDWLVLNPAECFGGRKDLPIDLYLAKAFNLVNNTAVAMALIPGWETSVGANVEVAIAKAKKYPFYDAETFNLINIYGN